jgi:uncharacterized protein
MARPLKMRKKTEGMMEVVESGPAARPELPPRRQSEFMVACASGDLAKVERMLADGMDPNQINDLDGTPLTWAVAWNRADVVECLLENGAEAEFPGGQVRSPLMYAASQGNRRIVLLLITHGADVLREDQSGMSSLHLAIDSGHYECARLLETAARLANAPAPARCRSPSRRRAGIRHCARRLRTRTGWCFRNG